MIFRAQPIISSISFSALIMLALCLGAQNLNERKSLNLGIARTEPLPTGFLIGTSIAIGVICGGCANALMIPSSKDKE